MVCPNCRNNNDDNNKYCSLCGIDLHSNFVPTPSPVEQVVEQENVDGDKFLGVPNKTVKRISLISNIFIVIPFFIFGIIAVLIGIFNTISEKNEVDGYIKTKAYLKETINCKVEKDGDYEGEYCEAVYEYEVNGVKYTASPDQLSEPDDFEKECEVYYNPENPSESKMFADWGFATIVGIILITIGAITVFVRQIMIKRILNNAKEFNSIQIRS